MPSTEQAIQFTAQSGESFVYVLDPFDGQVAVALYSPDGVALHKLAIDSFAGTADKHTVRFEDTVQGTYGMLRRNGDTIDYGVPYIQGTVTFDVSSLIPPYTSRKAEYLCQSEDRTYFYVSYDKGDSSYELYKLFVGDGNSMREVSITDMTRYRDGGTTYIKTPDGTLFAPQRLFPEANPKSPTWTSGGRISELTYLRVDEFDIVETPDGQVSITKKG